LITIVNKDNSVGYTNLYRLAEEQLNKTPGSINSLDKYFYYLPELERLRGTTEDENYNKSIIYIFFNNNEFCYKCPQAIELAEQVYNEYYSDKYSMFVINYQEDDEYDFASAYKLNSPLAIVLVKIQDGQALGYQKISNPQNMLSLGQDYILYLRQQIDNYLEN
jgi:hypothetical protein